VKKQGQSNYILLYHSFLNQFLADMYTMIETDRLNFIRHNQSKPKAENYVHLKDAMFTGDGQVSETSMVVIFNKTNYVFFCMFQILNKLDNWISTKCLYQLSIFFYSYFFLFLF